MAIGWQLWDGAWLGGWVVEGKWKKLFEGFAL